MDTLHEATFTCNVGKWHCYSHARYAWNTKEMPEKCTQCRGRTAVPNRLVFLYVAEPVAHSLETQITTPNLSYLVVRETMRTSSLSCHHGMLSLRKNNGLLGFSSSRALVEITQKPENTLVDNHASINRSMFS